MATRQKKKRTHRTMTAAQKANAHKSAKAHGRKRPGLWENVNASKDRGPKATSRPKGKTRPGKRSRKRSTRTKK